MRGQFIESIIVAFRDVEQPPPPIDSGNPDWDSFVSLLHLPPQQSRVVKALLGGKCNKEIAKQLGISVPTVRTHLTRIYQRTGTTDRNEMILRAVAIALKQTTQREGHRKR